MTTHWVVSGNEVAALYEIAIQGPRGEGWLTIGGCFPVDGDHLSTGHVIYDSAGLQRHRLDYLTINLLGNQSLRKDDVQDRDLRKSPATPAAPLPTNCSTAATTSSVSPDSPAK